MQFLAFSREIRCESTAIRKVTVKPLIHTTAEKKLISFSLVNIFARDDSEIRTCAAEVSI